MHSLHLVFVRLAVVVATSNWTKMEFTIRAFVVIVIDMHQNRAQANK